MEGLKSRGSIVSQPTAIYGTKNVSQLIQRILIINSERERERQASLFGFFTDWDARTGVVCEWRDVACGTLACHHAVLLVVCFGTLQKTEVPLKLGTLGEKHGQPRLPREALRQFVNSNLWNKTRLIIIIQRILQREEREKGKHLFWFFFFFFYRLGHTHGSRWRMVGSPNKTESNTGKTSHN